MVLPAVAGSNREVRQFLDENELPPKMGPLLPDDFRAFCLLLNAMKQWLTAEQAATDRYLLGGAARQLCRAMATKCLVTGEALDGTVELHHPVRDGRPPIPLSIKGHRTLEKQTGSSGSTSDDETDQIAAMVLEIKQPNQSWNMLRRGCRVLLCLPPGGGTKGSNASAKSFANKVITKTGRTAQELLDWLDGNQVGSAGEI